MNVAVLHDPRMTYPEEPPFHPAEDYPELGALRGPRRTGGANAVYAAVRNGFERLGFDREHRGSAQWNPLRELVRPGDRVVVKPNLVIHEHPTLVGSQAVFTHASLLRPIIDYVLLATGGDVRLTVADCPLQEADLAIVTRANGLAALLAWYRDELKAPVEFIDFRLDHMILGSDGRVIRREQATGDPRSNVTVHLNAESALEPITRSNDRFGTAYQQAFAVALYDQQRTASHHQPGVHEYLIPRTILESDVFINVPKLKTHQKAGITVCQKNLIGINADKSYLPHYREGSADEGGDEYPHRHWLTALNHRMRRRFADGNVVLWLALSRTWGLFRRSAPRLMSSDSKFMGNLGIAGGAWPGNDTLWRTILDINKILFFADVEGRLHDAPRRRYLAVVDGVVAGEGNGPILPRPRHAGLILLGRDPLDVDVTAARLMGFDWSKIPQLVEAARLAAHHYSDFSGDVRTIRVDSNDERWRRLFEHDEHLGFEPPPWWDSVRLAR